MKNIPKPKFSVGQTVYYKNYSTQQICMFPIVRGFCRYEDRLPYWEYLVDGFSHVFPEGVLCKSLEELIKHD